MKTILKTALVASFALAGSALAQDETEIAKMNASDATSFQYGASTEKYEGASGEAQTQRWFGIHSGHLTGGVDSKMQNYRLRANANGGELLGLHKTEVGKNFLNRFQIEAGGQSKKAPYGLIALELPVVKPVTAFVGSVHNPGGTQRFVVGPIWYYSNSHTMLFYYPRGSKTTSLADHSVVLRNRVREWGNQVWLDLDGSYKVIPKEDQVDGFAPIGYGASVGLWKVYGRYAVTPYYEGQKIQRTSYELGVDASF